MRTYRDTNKTNRNSHLTSKSPSNITRIHPRFTILSRNKLTPSVFIDGWYRPHLFHNLPFRHIPGFYTSTKYQSRAQGCEQLAQGCYVALPDRESNPSTLDRTSDAISLRQRHKKTPST